MTKISQLQEIELGDTKYFNMASGGTPNRQDKSYYGGEILWLKSGELKENEIYSSEEKITKDGLANSSAKIFPTNTILIAMYGATVGRLAILKVEAATNQAVCGITVNDKLVDFKYLFFFLQVIKDRLVKESHGGAQPNISQTILKRVKVPLPPIQIQKQIVSILERAEKLKEKRKQTNEEINKIIQSIFYEMFGDPIINNKSWQTKKGKGLFKFSSGSFNPKINLSNSFEFPTYGGNGINGFSKDYLIDFSTIVIGRVGAYCGSIHKTPLKAWVTDNAIYIKEFKNKINLDYIYFLFKYLNINRFSQTVGQPKITQKPLEELDYMVPPIELQNKFSSIVEKIESLKQKQLKSTQDVNMLFLALIQKAFNGELVND
mgnify:CR=1 FL=1